MESSLSDGLNLFGLFGASRTTRARQGASRAGHAGEEPVRARVGQGMREEEPMESSLSDGLNLFGLFGASRTTRARQGTSRAGHAGGRAHGKLAFRWAEPFRFIRRQPNHESPPGHESGRACGRKSSWKARFPMG